ncbi:transcriptional regulator GutM [Tetragenococcus koreensis]|uniref:transcriptional regulator GutM n=1 Tax=Tetragenococcus koreensis TaxID=290335 RepID=UPI001F2D26C8|nr:transcriptional regulator GutM [Tetragenococcus koreensis]MDN6408843.1 transcriptional regulator GutM [Tetragenococcus halophilus]MDN6640862.1 transcriptional regulator GutM [Tetragenococcus sp.]MCF1585873.1 transcriptional regulator GutM [Tetragenococcus koreensis]MCF1615443.1 transcriptional regulator GutM [Tetragenococcus koreensis]MCF1619166.1 transcriptional regulator GutM [Tetragenococcus koreensis]
MSFIFVFGFFAIAAYLLQAILGFQQIKHFNNIYQSLRKKGKVAIGRRKGKFKAGTLILFAVTDKGQILDARKMQGVTVLAKFHSMPQYIGEDIHYLDKYNSLVRKENKLLQQAMENAREVFLRVEVGNYQEEKPMSPVGIAVNQLQLWKNQIKLKWRRSV